MDDNYDKQDKHDGNGAAQPPSQPSASAGGSLDERLAAAEKQRDEYLAGWQRAKADFINYRKEEMRHLEEVAQYGSQDLIRDLVSVLDNFDLGLRALEKNGPVEKGVYLIRTQIEDILKKRGLQKIDLKEGDPFDPAVAEALSAVESDKPPGTVVEMIEPGYRLHDKVLRPARVILSKEK
ncbi:MAG TPA: nucleotide exchange factor GrpE [Candidatus Paceibacterota bacterium]|nr:nucleotide exchange factor GrpE [Candidatus Paceibacterota bacterium]